MKSIAKMARIARRIERDKQALLALADKKIDESNSISSLYNLYDPEDCEGYTNLQSLIDCLCTGADYTLMDIRERIEYKKSLPEIKADPFYEEKMLKAAGLGAFEQAGMSLKNGSKIEFRKYAPLKKIADKITEDTLISTDEFGRLCTENPHSEPGILEEERIALLDIHDDTVTSGFKKGKKPPVSDFLTRDEVIKAAARMSEYHVPMQLSEDELLELLSRPVQITPSKEKYEPLIVEMLNLEPQQRRFEPINFSEVFGETSFADYEKLVGEYVARKIDEDAIELMRTMSNDELIEIIKKMGEVLKRLQNELAEKEGEKQEQV